MMYSVYVLDIFSISIGENLMINSLWDMLFSYLILAVVVASFGPPVPNVVVNDWNLWNYEDQQQPLNNEVVEYGSDT